MTSINKRTRRCHGMCICTFCCIISLCLCIYGRAFFKFCCTLPLRRNCVSLLCAPCRPLGYDLCNSGICSWISHKRTAATLHNALLKLTTWCVSILPLMFVCSNRALPFPSIRTQQTHLKHIFSSLICTFIFKKNCEEFCFAHCPRFVSTKPGKSRTRREERSKADDQPLDVGNNRI